MSTKNTAYQKEAVKRLWLTFFLLSDSKLAFATALSLPTMEVEGQALIKRITPICNDAIINKVFYPAFPTKEYAAEVIKQL